MCKPAPIFYLIYYLSYYSIFLVYLILVPIWGQRMTQFVHYHYPKLVHTGVMYETFWGNAYFLISVAFRVTL